MQDQGYGVGAIIGETDDIGPTQSQAPLLDHVTHESTFHILENPPPRTWKRKACVPKDNPPSIRETRKRVTTDQSQQYIANTKKHKHKGAFKGGIDEDMVMDLAMDA